MMLALFILCDFSLIPEQEELLLVPEIRNLNEFEINYSKGRIDKPKLLKLERLDFPGGSVFISIPETVRKMTERRKKLLEQLSKKIDHDGAIKFSDLDDELKANIYMGIWGAEAADKSYDLPMKLDVDYRFNFEVNGQKLEVETSKPWPSDRNKNVELRNANQLVNYPKSIPTVDYRQFQNVDLPKEGLQLVFLPRLHRDLLQKNQILLEAQKAYLDLKTEEYKKTGEILDALFAKLVPADATESISGKAVPREVVDELARQLMHQFPEKYSNMDSALSAARQANCLGGSREVDLYARTQAGQTRYRLTNRPYNP